MMISNPTIPTVSPTEFCAAIIKRELADNKENNLWMSYWGVMQRLIDRKNELSTAFQEMINAFGYQNSRNCINQEELYLLLTLEHIWFSYDHSPNEINTIREDHAELKSLHAQICKLSGQLAEALRKQDQIYEEKEFYRNEYLGLIDTIDLASESNSLYQFYIKPELKKLKGQFDLKYWPDCPDIVEAIGIHQSRQTLPSHSEYPDQVLNGRTTIFKDFVLTFDSGYRDNPCLPNDFKFSNKAMADIINVVFDLEPNVYATPEAVKNIRNRYKYY